MASRNTDNHFGLAPMKSIGRSSFRKPFSHKTTFNTGDIVPIFTEEVLPGDTIKVHTASLVRMTTPINPVMDNAWMDTYFFFVPDRLLWNHWREFMGENTTDAWTQTTEYTIPQVTSPQGGWEKGTIAEKITGIQGREFSMSALYFRAYALIYNEWLRSENITEPAEISLGDATITGSNGNDYVTDLQKGGKMAKAAKYADYFTRALPEPQKGPDVYLPLGLKAPIDVDGTYHDLSKNPWTFSVRSTDQGAWTHNSGGDPQQYPYTTSLQVANELVDGAAIGLTTDHTVQGTETRFAPDNLYADLTKATAGTINQLRQAFAIQRMYEVDARGGTRYTEILRAHFGVTSPDARQQRPEYLGGKRVPINITQVIQQSSTDATSPQGTTAAYSLTIDSNDDFTYSSTEHGIIMGLAVIRTEHSYQQGLNRKFSRKNRLDYYWPELSNIGEQYIKNKEIFVQGTAEDEEAFGYQEAWAEYRYSNNMISGELNSDYQTPLDSWHYGDDYTKLPTLSDEWLKETDVNVARTLAINTQDQWIADFYFDEVAVRPMPIYSIPNLSGWM